MNLEEIKQRLQSLETSCLCDVDKQLRAMDAAIRPVRNDLVLVGTAYTVSCRDDFLTVIHSLREARPGDVLVIDGQGGGKALAGELFATEAHRKGLAGIVVDGHVRDVATLRQLDIPVYARGFYPTSGTTAAIAATQAPIRCGGVPVHPGEIVFGDQDGVIVGALDQLAALIPGAEAIRGREQEALARMARGESLIDLLNVAEHLERVRAGEPSQLKFTI